MLQVRRGNIRTWDCAGCQIETRLEVERQCAAAQTDAATELTAGSSVAFLRHDQKNYVEVEARGTRRLSHLGIGPTQALRHPVGFKFFSKFAPCRVG